MTRLSKAASSKEWSKEKTFAITTIITANYYKEATIVTKLVTVILDLQHILRSSSSSFSSPLKFPPLPNQPTKVRRERTFRSIYWSILLPKEKLRSYEGTIPSFFPQEHQHGQFCNIGRSQKNQQGEKERDSWIRCSELNNEVRRQNVLQSLERNKKQNVHRQPLLRYYANISMNSFEFWDRIWSAVCIVACSVDHGKCEAVRYITNYQVLRCD